MSKPKTIPQANSTSFWYILPCFFWHHFCLCSRHPRKRPKVNRTDAKAGSSSDRKTGPDRKTIAPVLKVEPHTPAIQYQGSDDEVEVVEGLTATPTYMSFDFHLSHDLHRIAAIPAAACLAVRQVYIILAFLARQLPRLRMLNLLLCKLSGNSDYIYFVLALYSCS